MLSSPAHHQLHLMACTRAGYVMIVTPQGYPVEAPPPAPPAAGGAVPLDRSSAQTAQTSNSVANPSTTGPSSLTAQEWQKLDVDYSAAAPAPSRLE
jgi:hypothetical protein